MQKEPVVSGAALAGFATAFFIWARMMGWIGWSDDQFSQFMIVMGLGLPIATAVWARARVTPVDTPRIVTAAGELVDLVRADTQLPPSVHP